MRSMKNAGVINRDCIELWGDKNNTVSNTGVMHSDRDRKKL